MTNLFLVRGSGNARNHPTSSVLMSEFWKLRSNACIITRWVAGGLQVKRSYSIEFISIIRIFLDLYFLFGLCSEDLGESISDQ